MNNFDNLTIESISIMDSDDDNDTKSIINDDHKLKSKFILKLDLNFKDQLIKLLNEYLKLLISDNKILINKEQLIKSKIDLIFLLTKSRSKLEKESNSSKFIVNLDEKFKYEIIDLLIKNEEILIDSIDEIDLNLKNELIKNNNYLITKLINLKVEFINNNANSVDLIESNEEKSKDDDVIDLKNDVGNLNEEINNLKKQLQDDNLKFINLEKQLSDERSEFDNLKKQLQDDNLKFINLEKQLSDNLKKQLDEIHINKRIPFTISCVKTDIKKFFENNDEFTSTPVIVSDIQWTITINVCKKFRITYLDFFINARNVIDNVKWECKATIELILKNNLPDKKDRIKTLETTFNKETSDWIYISYIYPICLLNISEDELLKNGFIKDDTIEFETKILINSIKRDA